MNLAFEFRPRQFFRGLLVNPIVQSRLQLVGEGLWRLVVDEDVHPVVVEVDQAETFPFAASLIRHTYHIRKQQMFFKSIVGGRASHLASKPIVFVTRIIHFCFVKSLARVRALRSLPFRLLLGKAAGPANYLQLDACPMAVVVAVANDTSTQIDLSLLLLLKVTYAQEVLLDDARLKQGANFEAIKNALHWLLVNADTSTRTKTLFAFRRSDPLEEKLADHFVFVNT